MQVWMLEWHGHVLFGRSKEDASDIEPYSIVLLLKTLPKRLERTCLAYWESLSEAYLWSWSRFVQEREKVWGKLARKPPRQFRKPMPITPDQRRAIIDLIPPISRMLFDSACHGQHEKRRRYRARPGTAA